MPPNQREAKIPNTIDRAFNGCNKLKEIGIPNNVTSIGSGAFSGCSGLQSVTIGSGVTELGDSTFSCSGLTSITIPENVTLIGSTAFWNCSGLQSVTIGSGVTSIGDGAFLLCSNLQEVHFENPNGWIVLQNEDMSGSKGVSGLENPATAAEYLRSTYCMSYWKREG